MWCFDARGAGSGDERARVMNGTGSGDDGLVRSRRNRISVHCHSICGPPGGVVRRRVAAPVGSICCPGSSSRSARALEKPRGIARSTIDGGKRGREGRRKGLARTVPRNHELMTPGHVSPFSSTLIPPVKTTVFAAAAGTKPGLGLTRNADISSTNGGSARAPASDRAVRRRGQILARGAPLLRVPTRRAGTAESTRFPPADDAAGVGRRHRAVVPGTEIVVIERPPRCAANARRATVAPRGRPRKAYS